MMPDRNEWEPRSRKLRSVSTGLLTVAFFLALGFSFTAPIIDPDFWWHLASGRWIWEHQSLMRQEAFTIQSLVAESPPPATFPFTQYWGSELIFFGLYTLGGLPAIILFRALLLTLLAFILYRLLRHLRGPPLFSLLMVFLAMVAVAGEFGYVGDRPQLWSSLFFVLLLVILERMRLGDRNVHWALPPLMLLWANLHGGFILGLAVIALYGAPNLFDPRLRRKTIVVSLAALAASSCNPNGLAILVSYVSHRTRERSVIFRDILEERPLWQAIDIFSQPRMPALALLLLLFTLSIVLLLPHWRKHLIPRAGIVGTTLLTTLMGLLSVRFMIFFIFAALLVITHGMTLLQGRLRLKRLPAAAGRVALHGGPLIAFITSALATAFLVRAGMSASFLVHDGTFRTPITSAADVLRRNGLSGNIFNEYGTGGYLVWLLHPSCRVFIYGRVPDPRIFDLYLEVMRNPLKQMKEAGTGTVPLYRRVFDEHRINIAVLPACDPATGYIKPLALALGRDKEWFVIHDDERNLVFVRRTREWLPVILRNRRPPEVVFDQMISGARAAAAKFGAQGNQAWRSSLGYGYFLKGQYRESLRCLDDYLARFPGDEEVGHLRARVLKAANGTI